METGTLVNDLLVEHFPDLINVTFTAQMEERLDEIATGEEDWVDLMREFYGPFKTSLERAEEAIPKIDQVEELGRDCPECSNPLLIRWGRYGKFIGCSNFPKCRYTEPWLEKIGVQCPECEDGDIVIRRTRKRRVFYGCSNWPDCEFNSWKRPIPQPCPECGGMLVIARKDTAQCLVCESQFDLSALEADPESDPEKELVG
jgi:DNA topoisomerase-1